VLFKKFSCLKIIFVIEIFQKFSNFRSNK